MGYKVGQKSVIDDPHLGFLRKHYSDWIPLMSEHHARQGLTFKMSATQLSQTQQLRNVVHFKVWHVSDEDKERVPLEQGDRTDAGPICVVNLPIL